MITVFGLASVPQSVIGMTRDLRVEWALEEMGISYQFRGLDFRNGEQRSSDYKKINPFQLVPAIIDDGFSVAESGAILLYLSEKYGKLIPSDFHSRMHVVQWCFSILNTFEKKLQEISARNHAEESEEKRLAEMKSKAVRWLGVLEQQLEMHEWIADSSFTVADILLASVLREVHSNRLIEDYPHLKQYTQRAFNRDAWQRALVTYSQRTGKSVLDFQLN